MALWKFGLFKICRQDISKTIWAKGLKLGQLIGDDEYNTWLLLLLFLKSPYFSGVMVLWKFRQPFNKQDMVTIYC